jgi:hypothetical protein
MTREVLKQALEALENIDNWLPTIGQRGLRDYEADAITAIKAALAQPEQEPVGHLYTIAGAQHCTIEKVLPDGPLFTAPPKRQPLTDKQIEAVMNACLNDWDWQAFARAIELHHDIGDKT